MDYQALKTELEKPQYQGLSDNAAADLLNEKTVPVTRSRFITARTILAEITNGADVLDKLEAAASQVSAVKWAMRFLQQDGGIDIGHPNTQAQIDALETGGVLTTAEASALKGMAITYISQAESQFGRDMNYNDINTARSL